VFLRFYGLLYPALGANPMSQFLGSSFLETRLSSESLEPLIGFLVYRSENYATKTKKWSKFLPPQKESWVE